MRTHQGVIGKLFLLLIAGLALAACHKSPTGPGEPPPTPAGSIACAGIHINYCVPAFENETPVWYAFWTEAADSSSASLAVGYHDHSVDSVFLTRDSTGWVSAPGHGYLSLVSITTDSVMLHWHGVDCGEGYELKKLH